jgi:hypothetical protein
VPKCVFNRLRLAFALPKQRERSRRNVTGVTDTHDQINSHQTASRTIMAELTVMDFKQDIWRASEVLNQLLGLNDDAGGDRRRWRKFFPLVPVERVYFTSVIRSSGLWAPELQPTTRKRRQ